MANLKMSIGTILLSVIYTVSKKHSGKLDQLTLASGGSENLLLLSVAGTVIAVLNFAHADSHIRT